MDQRRESQARGPSTEPWLILLGEPRLILLGGPRLILRTALPIKTEHEIFSSRSRLPLEARR